MEVYNCIKPPESTWILTIVPSEFLYHRHLTKIFKMIKSRAIVPSNRVAIVIWLPAEGESIYAGMTLGGGGGGFDRTTRAFKHYYSKYVYVSSD